MKHYKRSFLLLVLLLLFESFYQIRSWKCCKKNREVNGEIGSVNADGGNRSRGYGRSTWLWEVYRQK